MSGNKIFTGFVLSILLIVQPTLAICSDESECISSGLTDSDGSVETNSGYFEQQFIVAEQLRQAAASAGTEWLKTEELLLSSREQADNGNWRMAFELVQKACRQAELALQQGLYESEAWKHRVVD